MKRLTIFLILIVWLSPVWAQTSADKPTLTPTPSPISELANMSFKLGLAYNQAQLSQDVTVFNSLVDQYNALVLQHFSEGADALLMSKITATNLPVIAQKQQVTTGKYEMENPFKPGSELSKFGKHHIRGDFYTEEYLNAAQNASNDRYSWLDRSPAPL
jgi:hypothetical protein